MDRKGQEENGDGVIGGKTTILYILIGMMSRAHIASWHRRLVAWFMGGKGR